MNNRLKYTREVCQGEVMLFLCRRISLPRQILACKKSALTMPLRMFQSFLDSTSNAIRMLNTYSSLALNEDIEALKDLANNDTHKRNPLTAKLFLAFNCKVCSHRNQKFITKSSYEMGTVLVRCEGCENNHIIADHLNWFGEGKNVDEMMENKKGTCFDSSVPEYREHT